MKKIFALLLAFLMMLSLCSCGNETPESENPPEEIPQEEPAEEISREELYEEIVLNFGARKEDDGTYRADGDFSFYRSKQHYENFHDFGMDDDVLYGIGSMLGDEKREEVIVGEYPYNAFPGDVFESFAYKYFGIEAAPLRETVHYLEHEGKGWYWPFGPVYITEDPIVRVDYIEENGDIVIFEITVDYEEEKDLFRTLTVKLLPDGGYNYISYLPTVFSDGSETYAFKLGLEGEEREISVGDTIGGWALESISGDLQNGIEAVFTGKVKADCLIYESYREIDGEKIYFLEAVNGDTDKFPLFADDESLDITFAIKESDIAGKLPTFYGDKICCEFIITEFEYNFMPVTVLSFAKAEISKDWVTIETNEPEIIEKHMFALNAVEQENFAAKIKEENLAMLYKTDPGPGAFDKQPDAIVTREEARSEKYAGWFENQMIEECNEITNFRTEAEIGEYLSRFLAPEMVYTENFARHIIEFEGKAYHVWYSRGYGVKSYGNARIISESETEMTARAFIYHVDSEEAGTAELKFEKRGENWILVSVEDDYYNYDW